MMDHWLRRCITSMHWRLYILLQIDVHSGVPDLQHILQKCKVQIGVNTWFFFTVNFILCRIVKLCSHNLNYLIILGAALLYASVFMYEFTADRSHANLQTVLCNVRNCRCDFFCHMNKTWIDSCMCCMSFMQLRQWSYTLGYTLCFAVILAKTWRVYYIFTNPHSKKMVNVKH